MHTSSEPARASARSVAAAHLARIEDLSFLRLLSERLTAAPDFAAAARALVELLHEQFQSSSVAYASVDPRRGTGRIDVVAPGSTGARADDGLELVLDRAPWPALLSSVEPVVVSGLDRPPWTGGPTTGQGTLLVAATRVRGVTNGLILVWEAGPVEPAWIGEQRRLLAIVATLAALALDVARNPLREDFLAALRHDINNPVDAALGYVEMIIDTLQAEERSELVVLASSAAESMKTVADLVSNYLSMAVIDHGKPWLALEELDLGVLVAEVVRRYRPFAAERQVAIKCHGHCPALRADRRQLARVIGNLVSNAIKYTPPHGRVEVTVARDDETATLSVRDTGYGVPPERLPDLFGKYVRLHRDKGIPGTGLGLYISRAIVEAHDGEISVESTPGVGSCFTVRLPRERG